MTRTIFAVLFLFVLPALADDSRSGSPKSTTPPTDRGTGILAPTSQYRPAGTAAGVVSSVSAVGKGGGTITISVSQIEADRVGSRGKVYMKKVDKDIDYDLADDVKVRFGFRPKTPAPPDGLPGYKASFTDLHAGQLVKLTLGKKAEPGANLNAVKAVVTMVTIERDSAPSRDGKDTKSAKDAKSSKAK